MLDDNSVEYDYLAKYIIIGDVSVGKSNLLLRFAHGKFNEGYQATLCIELGIKNVKIRNKIYRIRAYDTAGSENFRSVTRTYYKSSACAIIVYDITNRESFNNVNVWLEECKSQTSKTTFIVLVGNKSDLEDERQVTKEEGQELAEKLGIPFFEASAKTGDNVREIFYNSIDEIAKKIENDYYDLEDEACGITQNEKQIKQDKKNSKKGGKKIQLSDGKASGKKKCCK